MQRLARRQIVSVKGLTYGGNGILVKFGKRRKVEEIIRVHKSKRITTVDVLSIKIGRRVGMHDGGTEVNMRTSYACDSIQSLSDMID